jgi:dienelactone hydrolase
MGEKNQLGAYGPWAAKLLGDTPKRLSLRSGKFKDVDAWRKQAHEKVWDLLAAPDLPNPKPRVTARGEYDGAAWEKLEWQIPWGPKTQAVFLKPANAKPGQKLHAILGLHDHGGLKFFGWKKIAQIGEPVHPIVVEHVDRDYGGLPWVNQAVKRGYAVLVHDTFLFGSRRVNIADVLPQNTMSMVDPAENEPIADVLAYRLWSANHEHLVSKSLISAGTSWPGVFLREDQAALSVLCSRPEVDASRVACGGLSGGGLRTVFLAGMDPRVKACFCAGFFTTSLDLVLYKAWTHTWMTFLPLLAREMDFAEIIGLRAPLPTLVLNCDKDPLFTLSEVRKGQAMLADVYKRAGAPEAFRFSLHKGGHQLNGPMQKEAFDWFDRWLGR